MKHFKLECSVMLALLLLISIATNAQGQAPANMKGYRGNNGSVYTFQVTGNSNGRIWGGSDNIYTDDSDIATAAVHAGLVSPGSTAIIKITILPGRSSYPSLSRNGINSIQYGSWDGSYKLCVV